MSKIIRSKRNTPFVQIEKTGPEDARLSWKAKGILAYILCKPDDWQIYVAELSKHAKDGKDATASGINELIRAGYIVRNRQHDDNGKFAGYDYQVFENPANATVSGKPRHGESTVSGFSVNGKTVNGKTVSGKPATTNNNSTNNNLTDKRNNERSAREKTEQEAGKVTTLKAKKNDSPQVAARPPHELDAHLTEEIPDFDDTPDWTTVAREMADYFNGPGADQWQFMCNAAGGYVDPLVITTAWAGKNCDAPYLLRNWKKQTGKLTNWIRNNLNADKIQTAKIKTLKNGKQRSTSDPLISDEDMERAYRELLAEGYK